MLARIYRKQKASTQSGKKAHVGMWILEFEKEYPSYIEPFFNYTSSKDTLQQVRLFFDSREKAEEYAINHNIQYYVMPSQEMMQKRVSYQDNFAYNRIEPWTH
ncbi:NADH dehydrogenase ubiquinone Fe-S protein 4 [Candidatus Liberibacter sp.]|uniref:NADH dehydrogenase ubiquinone Fe-S protein 4 n=1 Tax=Candidatus Liberibacter sp. TaxID=34022 RepID=UPI0015F3F452|nr:NADH dehydrogenase ubiquinone Fe-S protein 4 [Candidatus Liberibacter sp.]MBA5724113.1 ETC complex I subunit [Candidatus Liberibacter sp.]